MNPETAVVIFLREPVPGRVKTRLGAAIGTGPAAAVYGEMVAITLAAVRKTGLPAFLYYDGGLPGEETRSGDFMYKAQADGDLGEKMCTALLEVQQQYAHVILIGTDCPDINADILLSARSLLADHDIVLGPAMDGGYYLIGLSRPAASELFAGMHWSTSDVFRETLARADMLKLSVSLLPVLSDVDTADDLRRFAPHLFSCNRSWLGQPASAKRTPRRSS